MELRSLHYFIAVAETLNFSRAAERLYMAQPPLSQQIQRLEKEMGVQLFVRTKRSVRLTAAGEVFLQEAYRTLAQVEQAVHSAQQADRGEIGRLAIGFVGSSAYARSRPCVSTSRSAETPARSLFQADILATHSFRAVRTQERHIRSSHIVSVSQEEACDEHPLAVDHATKSSGSYRQSQYLH